MYPFTAHVCGGQTVRVEPRRAVRGGRGRCAGGGGTGGTRGSSRSRRPTIPPPTRRPWPTSSACSPPAAWSSLTRRTTKVGGVNAAELLPAHPNLAVLRTMSKWGGLAGLRVGYGLMAPELADLLLRAKPPYNVNQAAEAALLASIADAPLLNERAERIVAERERMRAALADLDGIDPWPSDANFVLCGVPQGAGKDVVRGARPSRGVRAILQRAAPRRLPPHQRRHAARDGAPGRGAQRSALTGTPNGEHSMTQAVQGPPCADGCGELVRPGRRFKQGHDLKLRGQIIRLVRNAEPDDVAAVFPLKHPAWLEPRRSVVTGRSGQALHRPLSRVV